MAPVTRSNSHKTQQMIDDEYAKKLKAVEDEKKKRKNKRRIELTCTTDPQAARGPWFHDPAAEDRFQKDAMAALEKIRVHAEMLRQKREAGEDEDEEENTSKTIICQS